MKEIIEAVIQECKKNEVDCRGCSFCEDKLRRLCSVRVTLGWRITSWEPVMRSKPRDWTEADKKVVLTIDADLLERLKRGGD